jgi:hypothetical protein
MTQGSLAEHTSVIQFMFDHEVTRAIPLGEYRYHQWRYGGRWVRDVGVGNIGGMHGAKLSQAKLVRRIGKP